MSKLLTKPKRTSMKALYKSTWSRYLFQHNYKS